MSNIAKYFSQFDRNPSWFTPMQRLDSSEEDWGSKRD
jgi:hypothetical protein